MNLGFLYDQQKDYARAESCYVKAAAIRKDLFGENSLEYAMSLGQLGKLEQYKGNYAQAEAYYLQSNAINKAILGEQHPYYAGDLLNLRALYQATGNYNEAERLYLEMIRVFKAVYGTQHPDYAFALNDLGHLYETQQQSERAQDCYAQALPLILDFMAIQGAGMDEKNKQIFFSSASHGIHRTHVFAAFNSPADSLLVWLQNASLLAKGYSLTGISSLLPFIKQAKDSSLQATYEQWIYTKHQLGKAYEMGAIECEKRGIDLDELERLATDQEAALMRGAAVLKNRLGYDKKRFYYQDLVERLRPKEIAIDFVRFEQETSDTVWYYALITQEKAAFPKYIPLCLESQLQPYAAADIRPDRDNYVINAQQSQELYALLIKPLEPYLKKVKTIHWSPVGLMNQVALGTLRDGKGKMLSERFVLHQYGSLKDFILSQSHEGSTGGTEPRNVLLVGDIAFDLDENEHVLLAEINNHQQIYASRAALVDSSRGQSRFTRLAGTKVEIEQLRTAFSSKKWQIEQLQQKDALEECVREYSGSKTPTVLHFATHGFFIPSPKQGYDNPLLRSGIALAGANRAWLGKPRIEGVEDGLWTAYEIAHIDLSPAELVVLSACETARGYIDPNEGVVGLQRAFKIAGVDNMLLSLWQVPDKETVELMQFFYQYYLNGTTPAEALRQAQLSMRKKYPNPYYWAAFILIE